MKISYNWLKTYVNFNYTVEELINILTMLGIEVEHYEILKQKYNCFFVGEIKDLEKHPTSEILKICRVNAGKEDLQVICGADNIEVGQKIVLGTIGAVVPANKLKIEHRIIRDHISEGMICSQAELELGADNLGIWVLPDDAPIGENLADYLKINDTILDISLTPNKSDCASHFGIARELAVYRRSELELPKLEEIKENADPTDNLFQVEVENANLCPRYSTRIIRNISNGKSPAWLKNELLKIGIRPINIVVDVTNLVLMEYGQPLHAFDLDKIQGNKIRVKTGFANKKFTTLDGKERTLEKDMLMICDAEKPIAIAGVMGGENSEITNETKNVVIESAYFNPTSIRRTSKKLMISTDASYRFERGTDIDMVPYALDRAASLIAQLTGGEIIGKPIELYPKKHKPLVLDLDFEKARKIIGTKISADEIKSIFKSLGFNIIQFSKENITVEIPHRRNDISSYIDLVEEVARFINYNSIEPIFTSHIDFNKFELPAILKPLKIRNKFRNYLSTNGFCELMTYNIVDPYSAELFTDKPITIANPLGEEMSKIRPSMITQMLKTIAFNINQGSQNLKLYETGKIFLPYNNIANSFIEGIDEREQLVLAICGNRVPRQWAVKEEPFDFFDIKGIVEDMFNFLKIKDFRIKQEDKTSVFNSEVVKIVINKQFIGHIGSVSNAILKKYDIEIPVFLAAIDMTALSDIESTPSKFSPISPYPVMSRDLAFIIDKKYYSDEICKTIKDKASDLLKSVEVFDVYQGKNIDSDKRSIAFNLLFSSNERTLTDVEVEEDINKIINTIETFYEAELRKA